MLTTSRRGVFALALHEGVVPAPYRDSVGVWTWGIGHTRAAGPPDPSRMPRGMPADLDAALREVFRVFRTDLARYEADVRRVLRVTVRQHEFDALVSFHFNTGAIARATLTRLLNAGDRAGAARAFLNWSKPPEIVGRRRAEQALFARGVYPGGTVPVWTADGAGRVVWQAVRRLTEAEVVKLVEVR